MEQVKISELNEIVAVVTNYTEGCKKGDTAQMRKAFDKGAVMYGYLNGQLYDGFVSEEQAGYFSHYPVSVEESYQIAVRCVIDGLHREEGKADVR